MASPQERSQRFLKWLMDGRNPSDLAAKLLPTDRPIPPHVPGGASTATKQVDKRWEILNAPASARAALIENSEADQLGVFQNHIENCIGTVKIPVGIAGPLRVRGLFASGDFYVPLATTEAALVASYSRGAQVITEAGGCMSVLLQEGITRTPGFAFKDLKDAGTFAIWCTFSQEAFKERAAATTKHGKLIDVGVAIEGNHVYVLLEYITGDAAGQNMVTIATQAVCEYIKEHTPIQPEYGFIEANFSGDKKATSYAFTSVRGKKVCAEVRLSAELMQKRLHTTPRDMDRYWRMSAIGGVQSGSFGVQGHYANAIAAFYIACGQDPACVAESAMGVTRFEVTEANELYASVTLPSIVVGSIGGGTALPSQRACLDILGLAGEGKAHALAELCAALALAGELSITAALCSNEFARAHERLARGRNRQMPVEAIKDEE